MKKDNYLDIFGNILIPIQVIGNLLCLLWTVLLSIEQVKTGWGYGTNFEIGVLFPWIIEAVSFLAAAAAIVFLILACTSKIKPKKSYMITNAILLGVWILQAVITNIFIWL